MPANIRMDEITQLAVINVDDPEPNCRTLAVTVRPDWWATANPISKELLWAGLVTRAQQKWAEEDAERDAEQAALASRVSVPEDAPEDRRPVITGWSVTPPAEYPPVGQPAAGDDATAIIEAVKA